MKTQKSLSWVTSSGVKAYLEDALMIQTAGVRMPFSRAGTSGPKLTFAALPEKCVPMASGDNLSYKSIVDSISASGSGLPTEKAVADAAYWIEVGRFTARQSGSGNKYDFIALKNAGYKYARVRQNRTGGYCGSDIDLSKITTSTQIKLIDIASFWSSSRIDIVSITQHAAEVTSGDFIFYKVSITISGTSASYALKNSGETETLVVEARK